MRINMEGRTAEIDQQRLTFAEGRAVEKVTGLSFVDFGKALGGGSVTALQALIWVAFKRSEPTLKFSDLDDWNMSALTTEAETEPEAQVDPTQAAPAA